MLLSQVCQQTILFCNIECLHFSSEHTVLKTSQRKNFILGDLVYFSTSILLRHTNFIIRKFRNHSFRSCVNELKCVKMWTSSSRSVLMGCQNSGSTAGKHLTYYKIFLKNSFHGNIKLVSMLMSSGFLQKVTRKLKFTKFTSSTNFDDLFKRAPNWKKDTLTSKREKNYSPNKFLSFLNQINFI